MTCIFCGLRLDTAWIRRPGSADFDMDFIPNRPTIRALIDHFARTHGRVL